MIRNFIYLDSQKLRSVSSQLFEGLTDSISVMSSEGDSRHETQKGPVASGKILADIFSQTASSSELRFLEDHAYTLFEDKLSEEGLLDEIDSKSETTTSTKSFIKVTAVLRLNDLSASSKTLKDFNEIGEAFWRVSNESMIQVPGQKILSEGDAKKKASEQGLQFNKKVTDAAVRIIEFGFGNLLEANMIVGDNSFSAPLKRQALRDDENMILHKYSRVSEILFTMLGIVTQREVTESEPSSIADVKDAAGIKEAMRTLALHLRTFEREFSKPSAGETILDPIAIYSILS